MQKLRTFFSVKRNLIALVVTGVCFLALLVGLTLAIVRYASGDLERAVFTRRIGYFFLCLVMMSAVYLVEALFRIRFPLFLELMLTVFAFVALGGGTVYNFYTHVPFFDKYLHFLSGPLFSIAGYCLASLLLKNQPVGTRKAVSSAVFALLFALAIGYVWEIFEFTVDSVIPGFDNQRWQSGLLADLQNGTYLVTDKRGTALLDTMSDMILNLIGAVLFCVSALILTIKKPAWLDALSVEVLERKKDPSESEETPASDSK